MLKKYIGWIVTTFCFFFIAFSTVHAADYKSMIEYMRKSASNFSNWTVGNLDSGYYRDIKIKIGKNSGDLKAAWKDTAKATFQIFYCGKGVAVCTEEIFNKENKGGGAVPFNVVEEDGILYLSTTMIPSAAYDAFKDTGTGLFYYATSKNDGFLMFGDKIEKKDTFKISGTPNENAVEKEKGKESNPYILAPNGSIKIPDKNDDFWKGMNNQCVYYKVDFSSKDAEKSAARYKVDPFDDAQSYIFWANDPLYTLGATMVYDQKDQLFQMNKNNVYAICASTGSLYGKTFTFEFVDTKQAYVEGPFNAESVRQNGDENVSNPDGTEKNEIPDPMPEKSSNPGLNEKLNNASNACNILSDKSATYQFIKKIVGYVQIGTIFLILVLGMLDLAGAVGSQEEGAFKKAGTKFGKRLIAGALVFLVPALVGILMGLISDQMDCNNSGTLSGIYGK